MLSQLYHNFISFPYFFHSYETCSINVNPIFHAAIKNLHIKPNGIFVFLLLHLTPLFTLWKSNLTDKMKRSFFQAAVVSILLYGCTTWTLTKRLEKKLDGNYTRMLRAILNKSWQQHHTRHQLYGHQPPIMKTIQAR